MYYRKACINLLLNIHKLREILMLILVAQIIHNYISQAYTYLTFQMTMLLPEHQQIQFHTPVGLHLPAPQTLLVNIQKVSSPIILAHSKIYRGTHYRYLKHNFIYH